VYYLLCTEGVHRGEFCLDVLPVGGGVLTPTVEHVCSAVHVVSTQLYVVITTDGSLVADASYLGVVDVDAAVVEAVHGVLLVVCGLGCVCSEDTDVVHELGDDALYHGHRDRDITDGHVPSDVHYSDSACGLIDAILEVHDLCVDVVQCDVILIPMTDLLEFFFLLLEFYDTLESVDLGHVSSPKTKVMGRLSEPTRGLA
jgi:hypothetical protein